MFDFIYLSTYYYFCMHMFYFNLSLSSSWFTAVCVHYVISYNSSFPLVHLKVVCIFNEILCSLLRSMLHAIIICCYCRLVA